MSPKPNATKGGAAIVLFALTAIFLSAGIYRVLSGLMVSKESRQFDSVRKEIEAIPTNPPEGAEDGFLDEVRLRQVRLVEKGAHLSRRMERAGNIANSISVAVGIGVFVLVTTV